MKCFVSSKHTHLLFPLLKPKTIIHSPSFLLRRISATPPPSDVTTQILNLLQNDTTATTTTTTTTTINTSNLFDHLSPQCILFITHQLPTTDGAIKFLNFLRTHLPSPQNPIFLSLTFEAVVKLQAQERLSQSDVAMKLLELFTMCKELGISMTSSSAILLVGFFNRARMVDESMDVYRYVDVNMRSTDLSNAIVDVLLRSGRFHDTLKVFDEMLELDTECGIDGRTVDMVFGELMRWDTRWTSVSQEDIAMLVSKCGRRGVFLKEGWLAKLIVGLCRKGNLDKAWGLLHELIDLGAVDIMSACNALLISLERTRNIKRMNMFLQMMKDKHIQPNVVTFSILIRHFFKFHKVDKALDVYRQMSEGNEGISVKPDIILYNTLIAGLCKVGRQEEAADMMEQMKSKHGCMPNASTYNALIDGFCSSGQIDKADEFFDRMNKEGVMPNVITVNTLVNGFCNHERVHTAIKFFRQMQAKGLKGYVNTYTTLINAFYKSNNVEKAANLFDEMLDTGCSPDAKFYYAMISGLTNAGRMDDASFIVSKMKEAGFQLDTVAYNVLIGGFCRKKKLDKAYELLKDMEDNGVKPDSITYNTLISLFSESGNFRTAHETMRKMVNEGVMPTVVTYGALINAYCLAGNLNEALRLFDNMCSSSRISPNNVIYNILIKSLCKEDRVEDALSLMQDMEVKGVRPNTNTFNAMFKGLFDKHLLEEALKLMEQMTQQACHPNYITMEILTIWLSTVGETEKLQKFVEENKSLMEQK